MMVRFAPAASSVSAIAGAFSLMHQSNHIAPAPSAGEFCAQRAGLAGCFR